MCGIAGIQTADGSLPQQAMLDAMRGSLAHRGPDGCASLHRADTALVHLRLAIVDLATGDQPLVAPDGVALVANGEIYNDPELRRDLAGAPFRTRSDCESALFLYQRYGADFACHLRGMYAIAIHDPAKGRLVLARDPFGIKPLYYVCRDTLVAFASEPQALLAAGVAARAIDAPHRAELLQLKFTLGSQTIFPGIQRVLPGETLVFEGARLAARSVLPALPPAAAQHRRTKAELEAVLLDSVAVHLRSDVPYGLFLSGGIDSTVLLSLMLRATGARIQTITMGWEGAGETDETTDALHMARTLGADCEKLVMTQQDFWRLAPRIAAAMDDPTADAAVLPTYMLGQAARAGGLKVALCGEGADELFGGYARYRKRRAPLRWISRPARSGGVFAQDFPHWRDGLRAVEDEARPDCTAMQAAQAIDIAEWLPNDLLGKLDRMLMAHGVEGRTPFLDPAVAAFAFPLPDGQKTGFRLGKLLLREWLHEAVPQARAFGRKNGFRPPVGAWIAARGPGLARLVAGQEGVAEVFDAGAVERIFANATAEPQRAWSVLFYALWHNHHVLGLGAGGDVGEVLGG